MTDIGPSQKQNPPRQENFLLNIAFNIIIPSLLLMRGKDWLGWSPSIALLVALAFPSAYFLIDLRSRGKRNFISVIGFISILITGGVGLLQLDKGWIAIKEAAVPALFGVAVLASLKTRYPLVRTFLFSPEIFDVELVNRRLEQRNARRAFDNLLVRCTVLLSLSFFLSAFLNFTLAKYFIRSESGTDAFNAEIGRMTLWSWPIIVLPTMAVTMYALFMLMKGIETHTGLRMEDILHNARRQKAENQA